MSAGFVVVLALLALKRDWPAWRELVLGGLCAILIGAASDREKL